MTRAQTPKPQPEAPRRRGLMLILSSPSGAGKSTLTRALKEDNRQDLLLSISVTTREKRPSEVNNVHYTFISEADFGVMRDRGELIEWAEVHGNFYGTPLKPIEAALAAGQDVLFDIDYQGTRQIVQRMRADTVTVFILPPSMAELKNRLDRRAEDSDAVIAKRLTNARTEIARWVDYDYVLINDNLDRTYDELRSILAAERLKRERQTGLGAFVDALLAEG